MPKTEIVEYSDGDLSARIVVSRATYGQEIDRAALRAEAFNEPDARKRYRLLQYADMISVTVEAKGVPWPMTVEQMGELPADLGRAWEAAVYRLNAWYGVPDEKKETPPAANSMSI